MAITALIAEVPEAEVLVAPLRLRHDPAAAQGIPAHITVLFPFMDPALVTPEVALELRRCFRGLRSFSFTLADVCRWPETTFLAPVPAQPFVELTRAVTRAFPSFPPYEGKFADVVPHLTIADRSSLAADQAEKEVDALMRAHGPIEATCHSVKLIENSSGRWELMDTIVLGGCDQ